MSLNIEVQTPQDGSSKPASAKLNLTAKVTGLTAGKMLQLRITAKYKDNSESKMVVIDNIEIT